MVERGRGGERGAKLRRRDEQRERERERESRPANAAPALFLTMIIALVTVLLVPWNINLPDNRADTGHQRPDTASPPSPRGEGSRLRESLVRETFPSDIKRRILSGLSARLISRLIEETLSKKEILPVDRRYFGET